ncbi:MAG: hypothetical protein Kow0027_16060 [Saprospiraceae bacterium]
MKMKNFQTFIAAVALVLVLGVFTSCQQAGGNQTGSEFIPDMTHSVAYEANVLTKYSLNTWDEESVKSRWELSQPGTPVSGTVPRGYAAIGSYDLTFASAEDAILETAESMKKNEGSSVYTPNGHVPYFYPDTEEGRTEATEKIIYNPFPITDEGLAKGKELYTIYCAICHGDKGDGNGYIVSGPQSKYLAQPANFTDDQFVNSSNGRFYHAIMYGKNVMGPHADKLSFEERWDVIHYIRSLQAKAKKVKYDSEVNELNPDYGVPYSQIKEKLEAGHEEAMEAHSEGENHSDTQQEEGEGHH